MGAGEALGTSNGELMMAAINRSLAKVGAEYLGHPAKSRRWRRVLSQKLGQGSPRQGFIWRQNLKTSNV